MHGPGLVGKAQLVSRQVAGKVCSLRPKGGKTMRLITPIFLRGSVSLLGSVYLLLPPSYF